jgi:tRNA pseudouridine55 synthase
MKSLSFRLNMLMAIKSLSSVVARRNILSSTINNKKKAHSFLFLSYFVRILSVRKMDGLIIINKPLHMTSHDVVNVVRKTLHTKKVGHAGTLDPEASGVLVVAVNKATKALQFLTADKKEYIATLTLGVATDTYDATGKVTEEVPFHGYDHLQEVLESFIGDSMQQPPMYSAIKVNGKKLYEYARAGEHVEVAPRPIHIEEMTLLKEEGNQITFKVKCSKGTYVRSLCVDLAKKLGYPGHMSALVRTRSGAFTIDQAVSLEDLKDNHFTMISLDHAFDEMDHYVLEDEAIALNGRKINEPLDHNVAVYNKEGHLLAIYGPDGNGQLKSLRGLF